MINKEILLEYLKNVHRENMKYYSYTIDVISFSDLMNDGNIKIHYTTTHVGNRVVSRFLQTSVEEILTSVRNYKLKHILH